MSAAKIERSERPLFLEEFVIHPRRNMIAGKENETTVEPKVMDVLCVLMTRQDEVISREEIIELVWGAENGGDERLTRAISQLRKAFSDPPRTPRFIQTVPKRGYRLVSPVRIEQAAVAPNLQTTSILSSEPAADQSRLVLVFGAIAVLAALAALYFALS